MDCEAVFPATSAACAVIVFAPEFNVTVHAKEPPVTVPAVPLQVTPATPDKASVTLPLTFSDDDVSVAPFAGDVMVKTGGVRSMFNVTLAVLVFPAVSVTVPVMTWFAPAVLTTIGDVQV